MKRVSSKPVFLKVLRIIAAAIPFIWIAWKIDLPRFFDTVQSTTPWLAPAVAFISLVQMFLQGYRWWLLMHAFDRSLPLTRVLSVHFKALFYSMVLPTSAAQDLVRAVMLSRQEYYTTVWGSTWVARLLGLGSLTLLATAGFFLVDTSELPAWVPATVLISAGIVLLLIILSFTKVVTRHFRPLIKAIFPVRAADAVERVRQGVFLFRGHTPALVQVSLVTLLMQLVGIANSVLILKAVTGQFFIAECLFFLPIVDLVVISVPLTPNGLGVREGLVFLFFQTIGLSPEAISTYIVFGLITVLMKLSGGVVLLFEGFHSKSPGQPSTDDKFDIPA